MEGEKIKTETKIKKETGPKRWVQKLCQTCRSK